VVTSPTGAAIHDIIRVIRRRDEGVNIVLAPARVQGDGAGEEIARAIELLNERDDVDVIIVGRGGGSIEDLWCFNEEPVARAIFNSRKPVISAVGHETDFTIADFVADLRASTPSAAAEIVTMVRDELFARVAGLVEDLSNAIRYNLIEARNRLSELESSRAFDQVPLRIKTTAQAFDEAAYSMQSAIKEIIKRDRARLARTLLRLRDADIRRSLVSKRGRLSLLEAKLSAAMRILTERKGERLSVAAGKLGSLSPLAVLARGYAIAFGERGQIIKRASDIKRGERVRVRLAEGEIDCLKD
jgi:exodeoxyribonuclease VII large subunit